MSKVIKVGCCGFPLKKTEYFKKFPVVEIQSIFYQPPARIKTVERWRKEAPQQGEFAIKAWQLITHPSSSPTYRRLKTRIPQARKGNYGFFKPTKEVFEAWEKTREVARILDAKIIVFQCPASFKSEEENIENLREFFKKIKQENLILTWEPRGEWDVGLIKNLCQELNLVHCVDPFKQKSISGKINYFRLHGKPGYNLRYEYTDQDLDELTGMCDRSINYCMFNNLSMVRDAQRFKTIIQKQEFTYG
jgi:uncharacterized protein YecE (DUF72 family)